ncbi:MAG: vacuolar protein sorting-associated protein 35 [archaeon]|nr:vacuolar protein sorting-associated protein 35 [archaeon]
MGIGDWGLGIGDWARSPIPNPQSPIPNNFLIFLINITYYTILFILFIYFYLFNKIIKKSKIKRISYKTMEEEKQEQYLDDCLKAVKGEAYHLKAAIERNNMRQTLRQTAALLNELRTSLLTPRSYYSLYTVVFDEMQYVYNFIKEEARRGRRMRDLYDTVQQAGAILPRLYLMITTAAVLIENSPNASKEKIFDLLNMVKGIQNPTRGLFTRYYLLKMIKDKLPDKGNQYDTETSTIADTLQFILQNLEEMNRLWIRLSTGVSGNEKVLRERERQELKILVGENIVRLSSLDGLTLDMYKDEILPKIINILLDSKDQQSQQYLMECLIHAFPDEYNITCMQTILDTMTQLTNTVDVKALLISLMDKIARYVGEQGKESGGIVEQAEKIFDQLKASIDNLVQQGSTQRDEGYDPIRLIELQVAFMKFTVKCCPAQEKLNTINHIFETSLNVLTSYNKKLNQDGVNYLRSLLSVPLESELSLFEFKKFPELMVFLDFSSRTTLAIRIIESLNNKEKLDSTDKINILLGFIRPLLEDSSDTIEVDAGQFEYEQNVVSKMLYVINTNDPEKLMEILSAITPEFLKGGNRRIKYTLPTLVHCFLNLAYQFCQSFEAKNGQSPEGTQTGITQEYLNHLDMSKIDNESTYEKYLGATHNNVNQIISMLVQPYPDIAFKLFLTAALQSNAIKISFEKFNETTFGYLNGAFAIYKESELDPKKKVSLFNQLISTMLQLKNLPIEPLSTLVVKIQEMAQSLAKRAEQCNSMIACSHLFYTLLGKPDKAKECLNKAKRFADFAMTNPEHLNLFVILLNQYIYFIDNCGENNFITQEAFEDVIETIRNHIQTIKTENTNQSFLPDIERYFDSTMEIIKKRKEENNIRFYSELTLC